MNPKITKGHNLRGLLAYLWGRGKADEHTNPHIVAGYDDPAVLAPGPHPYDPTRFALAELTAKLLVPHVALGDRGVEQHVMQVALSNRADERVVSEAEWQRIAERFVELMGLGEVEGRAGCRWIAVHHGTSVNGNDHIHVVVVLATEDGAPVYLHGDFAKAQQVCDQIEDEFGLAKNSPGRRTAERAGALPRQAIGRPEVEQARRAGRAATDREALRRAVRVAVAGARDEAQWVARMKGSGLLVAARADKDDPATAVGYAVALRPDDEDRARTAKVRWLSGRRLDADLSLVKVRQRWPGSAPLSPQQWRDVVPPERVILSGPARIEVWRSTVAALQELTGQLAVLAPDSAEWPSAARASAELLAVTAAIAEPSGYGPVSSAADVLARAAAPRRGSAPLVDGRIAQGLGQLADQLLVAGAARRGADMALVLAVVIAVCRLVEVLGRLRTAQQDLHGAGAAWTATQRMLPFLHAVHAAGVRAPAAAVGGPVTPSVAPAVRGTVRPDGNAPALPGARPGHEQERDPGR